MSDPTVPVVPAGRMRATPQLGFGLRGGMRLRAWREDDAAVLARSCRDPDIAFWNRPAPLTLDAAREKIARWARRWESEAAAIWAVAPDGGGEPVGLMGLADLDLRGGSGEFLYWLLPEGRGKGVMADATDAVSQWAFDAVGFHRLRITHSVANTASCNVALAAGFALEGTMRSALLHADGWHDEHLHARIATDARPSA